MPAVSHRHELVYFPIPKNATTSVKMMFYAIDAGHPFDEATASRLRGPVHRLYSSEPAEWLDYYAAYTSLVIVRDPVKRVLSAYANRVLIETVGPGRAKTLERAGLSVKPTLDEFLDKFHRYRKFSKIIRKHTIPQAKYIGEFWDKLSIKLPMERLSDLPKILEKTTGTLTELPSMRVTKKPIIPDSISRKHIDKLVKFYQKDYELLKSFYSPDMIR